MRGCKLRGGVYWQGALNEKTTTQVGCKTRAVCTDLLFNHLICMGHTKDDVKSSSWCLYTVLKITTDTHITVLILFHLLSYTHYPIKPCVHVHNVYAWLVFYWCPSSLFCSFQLAAKSHQQVMLFQVWDFWNRNINHFDNFSTCLYHCTKQTNNK